MDSYVVEFAKRAEKDLRRIDTRYIPRIVEAAENLASDPRPPG
jgi:mRNA-degrading endonuclease RelE of RelBE toxin-antitoxin system